MRMITLTRASDGSKVYVNPEHISMVSSSPLSEKGKTIVSTSGDISLYVIVMESPETVVKMLIR